MVLVLSALAQLQAGVGAFVFLMLLVAAAPMFATDFSGLVKLSVISALPALLFGIVMFIPALGIAFIGFVLFGVPFLLGVSGRIISLLLEKLEFRRPNSLVVELAALLVVYGFALTQG